VFGGRVIEQLRMDAIASGGGSVHCATQQEPHA
jgi:agmatine deiminase